MTRISMFSNEALDRFEPFHDLPVGAVPDISIAGGTFAPMTAAPTYGTALDDADPDKTAAWYTVRFVGADNAGTGLDVPTGWSRVEFRVVSAGRTDVKPDPDQNPLWLVVTARSAA